MLAPTMLTRLFSFKEILGLISDNCDLKKKTLLKKLTVN